MQTLISSRTYEALKIFLPIFLLAFIGSVAVAGLLLRVEFLSDRKIFLEHEVSHVEIDRQSLINNLENVFSDVHFLAGMDALDSYLNTGNPAYLDVLKHDYLHFCRTDRHYDQIRFLDSSGMEIVRINYNAGALSIVPAKDLQDKSKRYYFSEVFRLQPGKIYISPLDLNIEHGEIELPYKPMLRIGTPVSDKQGNKRGIVLTNYLTGPLLEKIRSRNDKDAAKLMLINNDGYWLMSPNKSEEWGFMFDERKDISFARRYPQAWHTIYNGNHGQFTNHDGIFTFTTICTLGENVSPRCDRAWKIVSLYPRTSINDDIKRYVQRWLPVLLIWTLFIILASLILASAIHSRRTARRYLKTSEERYRTLFEESPLPMWEIDISWLLNYFAELRAAKITDFREFFETTPRAVSLCASKIKILDINRASLNLFGLSDKTELTEAGQGIFLPETWKALREMLFAFATGSNTFEHETIIRNAQSDIRHVLINWSFHADPRNPKFLLTITDITNLKEVEDALSHKEAILRETQRITRVGGWEYDVDTSRVKVTPVLAEIFGITTDELESAATAWLRYFPSEARPEIEKAFTDAITHGTPYDLELPFITAKGRYIWVRATGKAQLKDGQTCRLYGSLMDITAQKKTEEKLRELATTDGLTGICNRRHFMELSNQILTVALRYKTPLSLLIMDADHFKNINDSYGHDCGDKVLQCLTRISAEAIRDADILARIGGEEFALLMPETSLQEAIQVAERLRRIIAAQTVQCNPQPVSFTVSIGVATVTNDISTVEGLLKLADTALYQAKAQGRNRVESYGQLSG